MTQGVVDYLMWHHFGRNPEERNHDLAQMYKSHFERSVNPTNLAMLINSYIHRTDLQIARTPSGSPQVNVATLKMPVINITGALSPHVDDTVTLNGRLDPTNSSWMKVGFSPIRRFDKKKRRSIFLLIKPFRSLIALWYWKNNRESWPKHSDYFCKEKDTVSYNFHYPNGNDITMDILRAL